MSGPRIKSTVVGSYPMIDWLVASPTRQALDDATSVVLKTQELAGLDVVADGELYRFDINHPETNGMIEYFVRPLENVRADITRKDVADFQAVSGMGFRKHPAASVDGPIGEGRLDLVSAYKRVRKLTNAPLKFTITGPHMLTKTLLDRHYGDRGMLARAIGQVIANQVKEIDADIVQLDEANLPGHPDEADWAADAINIILDSVPNTPAVHLCFGNYGGQSIQKGTWDALLNYINSLHTDHMVMEFAFRGYDELARLKDLRDDIGFGIGVIDIKTTVVESPELVAERIEAAAKHVGADRIKYVHPDCGFWMLKRSIADAKMEAIVKGRDLFEGR
ncbi:MAG: cobalamin-independent methionine synthase II family protein [Rhodothermales bacterium]|nr:cobalamin-independent methionine synthase II family protein [Rhodothermales bacterium]